MPSRALVFLIFVFLFNLAEAGSPETRLEKLKNQARNSQKIILLGFFSDACSPSSEMKRMLSEPQMRVTLAKHLVVEQLDMDHEPEFCEQYDLRATPTFLFLKPDGTLLRRTVGFRNREAFLKICENIGQAQTQTAEQLLGKNWDLKTAYGAALELHELGRDFEAFGVLLAAIEKGRRQTKPAEDSWSSLCWMLGRVALSEPALKEATERFAEDWSKSLQGSQASPPQVSGLARLRSSLESTEALARDLSRLEGRAAKCAYTRILQKELLELGLAEEVTEFGTVIEDFAKANDQLLGLRNPKIHERLWWAMAAARRYQLHLLQDEFEEAYALETRAFSLIPERADWLRGVFVSRACDCKKGNEHHLRLLEESRPKTPYPEWSWLLTRARLSAQLGRESYAKQELEDLLKSTTLGWQRDEIESALEELK